MEDVCIPKAVFFCKLQEGKRDRGAPRKHYKDQLKKQLAQAGISHQSRHHNHYHHHHHHQSLDREGRWGTTDDLATSFLHFPLFSTALWDLPNSRPVHSLMLSSHRFLCLPCLLPPFTAPCKMLFLPDLMNGRHDHTTAVCVSLRWSGGLRVGRLPAGSWHGLPRW